jgi:FSR family fosmidomycin resistance protein-like MFS transporter
MDAQQSDQFATPAADAEAFRAGQVLAISAGHAVHDTYTAFLPSLLPVFIANLALSNTEAGLLDIFLRVPSLLQPLIGHAADRLSLRVLFILAPAVSAAMMSLLGIAPGYAVLALFLLVTGTSSACLHAIGPIIAGNASGRSLGRGMGFWMVGGELGRALGPIVIVSAIHLLTLRGTPWLMLGGVVLSAVLALRIGGIPERPREGGRSLPWRQALRGMGPVLAPLIALVVVRAFMVSALTTYLPTMLSEEGADLWFAGAALSVLEGAGVVGALLGGSISDRLGRRVILFISTLVTPLLMFVFQAVDGWLQLPLLLVLGFSALSTTPVVMALVQESFPENRALANGVYMALSFVLRSGVVVAMGAMGDLFGLRQAFTASAVITLLGLPLVFLLPGGRKAYRSA